MITAWILYAIVVGALFGGSGLALERFLRTHNLPSRWVWVGAVLLSVGWPLGHLAWEKVPEGPPALAGPSHGVPQPSEITPMVFPLEPITVEVPPESILRLMDGPIVVGWALATSLHFLFFGFLLFRTHRLRSHWRSGKLEDLPVLFSDDWGPAVVGFIRPQIVLPTWCEELDRRALRFVLDHEVEHLRAGDLRLVILTGIFPVLFPWHLPVWWQLTRLRTAVESDCDQRVLGRNPGQTRPYVDLLLEVGERASRGRPLAAMLSEPYETLKRRIRIMTMPFPTRPWIRGGLLMGAGATLVTMACWAPEPTDVREEGGENPAAISTAEEAADPQEGEFLPVFTPFSVRPSIRNLDEVLTTLSRDYPTELREAGIGGTVNVWFFIDETGKAQRVMVAESSRHRELDNAAVRVGEIIEFSPALNRDQGRPVWVSLPVEFTTNQRSGVGEDEGEPAGAPSLGTVMTVSSPGSTPAGMEGGRVTGAVVDQATQEPLRQAQVLVGGTGRGTLADENGRFVIDNVPAGEWEFYVHLIGFGEVRQAISVQEGESMEMTVEMAPQAIALNKLTVGGTRGGG